MLKGEEERNKQYLDIGETKVHIYFCVEILRACLCLPRASPGLYTSWILSESLMSHG